MLFDVTVPVTAAVVIVVAVSVVSVPVVVVVVANSRLPVAGAMLRENDACFGTAAAMLV